MRFREVRELRDHLAVKTLELMTWDLGMLRRGGSIFVSLQELRNQATREILPQLLFLNTARQVS